MGVVDCGVIYLFIYFFEEGAIPTISSESTVTPKKKTSTANEGAAVSEVAALAPATHPNYSLSFSPQSFPE